MRYKLFHQVPADIINVRAERVYYSWEPLRGTEQQDLCQVDKFEIDGCLCDLNVGMYFCLNDVTHSRSGRSFNVGKKEGFLSNEAN